MSALRERPYSRFNFLVDIGTGDTGSVEAGFSEVSGLDLEVQIIEYRNGNSKTNMPTKINGLAKVGNVTMRRGVIGSLGLYEWIDEVRTGSQSALRNVTVQLLNEDRTEAVQAWKLSGARPTAYIGPTLSAATNDVAIEELVLACEDIAVE